MQPSLEVVEGQGSVTAELDHSFDTGECGLPPARPLPPGISFSATTIFKAHHKCRRFNMDYFIQS